MADRIRELAQFTLLTNSDAHSLEKIGREYNVISLVEPNFEECLKAFMHRDGRELIANYGINPRLGKYYSTFCVACGNNNISGLTDKCPSCNSTKIVKDVFNRIEQIADFKAPQHPCHRGPYFYQIPLEFIPGIGKKTLAKLLQEFGTEMNVIHYAKKAKLEAVIGEKIALKIITARSGLAQVASGGGGIYGKVIGVN